MGYGFLCGLWVWRRRTNRRTCCSPMSNPSTSPWTTWPDGSGRWDNRMAAQHLPRNLARPSSGSKKNSLKRKKKMNYRAVKCIMTVMGQKCIFHNFLKSRYVLFFLLFMLLFRSCMFVWSSTLNQDLSVVKQSPTFLACVTFSHDLDNN